MLEKLPTELLILVVEHAVELFLVEDRETLIHLAQTSKHIYAVIAPLIYHSISFCESGKGYQNFIESYVSAGPSLAERVFQHTKELHAIIDRPGYLPCILLKNVETMNVSSKVAYAITMINNAIAKQRAAQSRQSAIPPPPLRRLSIWNRDHSWIPKLSERARHALTHFHAFTPDSSDPRFEVVPRQWILDSLELLPNLTHLGFELYAEIYDSALRKVAVYDSKPLKQSLLAALEYRRADGSQLQVVAVRIAGQFSFVWPKLLEMMQQVENEDRTGRLRVWHDIRLANGESWRNMLVKDGYAKRSVWTEARAVRDLRVPSLAADADEDDTPNQNSAFAGDLVV